MRFRHFLADRDKCIYHATTNALPIRASVFGYTQNRGFIAEIITLRTLIE